MSGKFPALFHRKRALSLADSTLHERRGSERTSQKAVVAANERRVESQVRSEKENLPCALSTAWFAAWAAPALPSRPPSALPWCQHDHPAVFLDV
jgi:hypothetical protein